jgi:signal transduction histidine kinase
MLFEEYSNQISELRRAGKIDEAIVLSKEAIISSPDSYFFPKVAGDLYFQIGDYQKASEMYFAYLKKSPPNQRLFNDFAQRYFRLKRTWTKTEFTLYAKSLLTRANEGYFQYYTAIRITELVTNDIPPESIYSKIGQELDALLANVDDTNFSQIVSKTRDLDTQNPSELLNILDQYLLETKRALKTINIDRYIISIYEKHEKIENALKLSVELVDVTSDPVIIRSMLRLSRKIRNYALAETAILKHPEILKSSSFNILYELVYYYEFLNDLQKVKVILNLIEKRSSDSIPILSTLRNFYSKFGLYDDANRVSSLSNTILGRKFKRVSSDEVLETTKQLQSDFEHKTRLAAISDLTTGISHELGQPITNIRYTIQFYRKILENNFSQNKVFEIFDSILEETERMGQLVKRLSPITSSKSLVEEFDIVDRINKSLKVYSMRLEHNRINTLLTPSISMLIKCDPIKFDQIFNNLILNSIDAIEERNDKINPRFITIKILSFKDNYQISFSDTGIGIPLKHRGRMFEPFFSTKPPGKGTGLGLFIVWNIIKIFGGKIALDSNYNNGACFVITIPKDTTKTIV